MNGGAPAFASTWKLELPDPLRRGLSFYLHLANQGIALKSS